MLPDRFLGKRPSHFHINHIVKAYIVSEAFLWSAWDFIIPIFSLYVVGSVAGGSIQTAAIGYSTYLISRVIFELISGRILAKSSDRKKLVASILGMCFLSAAYIGFIFSDTILLVFLFYFVLGIGLGIAAPAKNSLFSIHLDKNKEATEWSITDAISFICMAMATALGGFVAATYGFQVLFMTAAVINMIATIPYITLLTEKQAVTN